MSQSIDTPFGPYTPEPPSDRETERAGALMADIVAALARASHDKWAEKRIQAGWRYGPRRDDENKRHPDLVPYEHLSEEEKSYDVDTARVVVAELMRRGLLG